MANMFSSSSTFSALQKGVSTLSERSSHTSGRGRGVVGVRRNPSSRVGSSLQFPSASQVGSLSESAILRNAAAQKACAEAQFSAMEEATRREREMLQERQRQERELEARRIEHSAQEQIIQVDLNQLKEFSQIALDNQRVIEEATIEAKGADAEYHVLKNISDQGTLSDILDDEDGYM